MQQQVNRLFRLAPDREVRLRYAFFITCTDVIKDDDGNIVGAATRDECHGNPSLIHRAVHVLVFNRGGQLYLQRRSKEKIIQPGKWDTSVGGHLETGESYEQAAYRETLEELGFTPQKIDFLFSFKVRNSIEAENINTYRTMFDGPIAPHPEEIEDGRYWGIEEIYNALNTGVFTPAFEHEFTLLRNLDV